MQAAEYTPTFRERLSVLGFETYGAYLASDHWRNLRRRWCQHGRPQRCAVCRSKRFQLHHTTYERLGSESLDDLVALCRHCHGDAHALEAQGIKLAAVHTQVRPVVLREEQYLQDRERARRKGLGMTKPKKRRRKARATSISQTRKTRKIA